MDNADSSQDKLVIILNQPPSDKIPVFNNLAVFKDDGFSVSVPVDHVTEDTVQFSALIIEALREAKEMDHILFVFASDLHYSENTYFQEFLEFVETLFVYDIIDNCQDQGVLRANEINSEVFSPLYAYLKLSADQPSIRASLLYISSAEHFPLMKSELKNVFTGAKHSSHLSEVTHIWGVISSSRRRRFAGEAAEIFYGVQEMHLMRVARGEDCLTLKEISDKFASDSLRRIILMAWRHRAQKLGLICTYLLAIKRAVPKCALFFRCLPRYTSFGDFQSIRKARQLMERNARQLRIETIKSDVRPRDGIEKPKRPLDLHHMDDSQIVIQSKEVTEEYACKYSPFGRLVRSVLRDSLPFLQAPWTPPVDIYVNIYHIIQSDIPSLLGIGIYHSALELGPIEVAFGGHPYAGETGVFFIGAKKMAMGARFYKQQYIGKCWLSKMASYEQILRRIPIWEGKQYELLHRNCNDFTDEMCVALTGTRMPSYINRAASIGGVFRKRAVQKLGSLQKVVMRKGSNEEVSEDEIDDEAAEGLVI